MRYGKALFLIDFSETIKSFIAHVGFSYPLQGESAIPIKPLTAFVGRYRDDNDKSTGIHFEFKDYLELLNFTGRAIRDDKRGHIDLRLSPILQRLNIEQKDRDADYQNFEVRYYQRFAKNSVRKLQMRPIFPAKSNEKKMQWIAMTKIYKSF